MKAVFKSVSNKQDDVGEVKIRGVVTVGEDGKATVTEGDDDFKEEYFQPVYNGKTSVSPDDGEAWCKAVQARFSHCSNFYIVLEN